MTPVRTRVSRLPLRIRLVAGFSAATFVVLLAAGVFVYWRVDYALDRGLDTELAQASQALDPLIGTDGTVTNRSAAEATGVAWQVLASDGTVLDHGGPAGTTPMVSVRQLGRVRDSPHTYNVGDFLPAAHQPYRLRVAHAGSSPQRYLLVGVRRDHRDEALRELLVQLSLAGLGALLVTAFVGERLARAALRPVERYRRRAAAIAAGNAELRLDVPPLRDDEITRLGHTFNDMLSSLEEALDRERQFVSDASHELRTPVTLLTSRVQLALRRPRSQREHEHILTELKVDLDRLAGLAEQLLQVGRVDSGTVVGSSNLVAVIGRVINQRRLADPADAGDVSVTRPSHPLPVGVADFELERILTNLLDNAVAHGAPPFQVAADEPSPGWARMTVSDFGAGMPPALLATGTQRFARADDARPRPGAGLGLSLVDALVGQAGGELRLCHDGRHSSHGRPAPVPCAHGPEMTVTVLLPTIAEAPETPAGT
ncbi:two-component sensor histidine kinase [Nocardioides flavus (ex Wang et al. 2016)]|uniref:histidine kinase n=1 Tax=Nocardioides flavus (ex Wang et al. 2016) TaxID=2058780 RepID=A0ABQ3HML1_9ACTN|nr:ATP-binding protein [Nocardioides flavus (ex Wang et al. 2016)]GHE18908.1 two-component sensor histidine kinase [Nocardioides flavus (ex Wang et al. 2016)]